MRPNVERPWWRDPAGRPPWVKPRKAPAWLVVAIFAPLCLAPPVGAVFGVGATLGYVLFWLIGVTVMLCALPNADGSEAETAPQWRWTIPSIVALSLISSAAAWWLRGDGF